MGRLARILRHRWHDRADIRRALGPAGLKRIEACVAASERHHSGQIRVCIEAGLPLAALWRGAGTRERAVELFGTLRVWDTEHDNGVLIYLLLAERAIEIVADRGLTRHVPQPEWQRMVDGLGKALRERRIEEGLTAAIAEVDALLVRHFPLAPGERPSNELPDAPDLR